MDSKSILKVNKDYKFVYIAVSFSVFAILLAVFAPGLQVGFGVAPQINKLSSIDVVLFALAAAVVPTLIMELKKLLRNGKTSKNNQNTKY